MAIPQKKDNGSDESGNGEALSKSHSANNLLRWWEGEYMNKPFVSHWSYHLKIDCYNHKKFYVKSMVTTNKMPTEDKKENKKGIREACHYKKKSTKHK